MRRPSLRILNQKSAKQKKVIIVVYSIFTIVSVKEEREREACMLGGFGVVGPHVVKRWVGRRCRA